MVILPAPQPETPRKPPSAAKFALSAGAYAGMARPAQPSLQVGGGHVRCAAMAESSVVAPRELPRKLGLVTGMAVVVGVIIGSGIFRVPSPIAAAAGNLTGIALVWILGGIVALFGALSIAE